MPAPTLLWLRQDLRLADNPALADAARNGPVVALYVLDDGTPGDWRPGDASRWWLHHSLAALREALSGHGVSLVLRRGRGDAVVETMVAETGARRVAWNRCYEPFAVARDRSLRKRLEERGVEVASFCGNLLDDPWAYRTGGGTPYRVYTPFAKAVLAGDAPAAPLAAPERIEPGPAAPSEDLDDWALLPTTPDWAAGLRDTWEPGEAGAQRRLAAFLDVSLASYRSARDRPDLAATSRLSPHLHFGEIGPRQIWHAARHRMTAEPAAETSGWSFLREIVWREFSYNLLFHFPGLPDTPLKAQFAGFPWEDDADALDAWRHGRTGYPIVDAGMRELWHCGWMHNRVRMIVGSFLVKDLRLHWRHGEAWFWDTLVDADLASNAASWQWIAGCGTDAAPYFRVFNPVLQGRKFDPDGAYVRRWVPEIAGLPDACLHAPWEASEAARRAAGVRLGTTYPHPIVDHRRARAAALAAYDTIRQSP